MFFNHYLTFLFLMVPLAVYGQVARQTKCIKERKSVTVNLIASGSGNLAQNRESQVHEFNNYHRILDLTAFNKK